MYDTYFYLVFFVNVDIHVCEAVLIRFGTLLNTHLGILEAFLIKIVAYEFLRSVQSVLGYLTAGEYDLPIVISVQNVTDVTCTASPSVATVSIK